MKYFYQPVKPFLITQKFGENKACVSTDGQNKVITCDGLNPPQGYKSVYGNKGHLGLDLHTYHGQEVYCAQGGEVVNIDTNPKTGLDVKIVTQIGGRTFKHIYEHLLGYQCKIGDKIETGQLVGWTDNCFDKETEVLTDSGWKFLIDLTTEDKVATINMNTENIEFQKPTKYTRRYEEKMYLHKNKNTDFCVSSDHNILVKRGWRKNKLRLEKFSSLYKREAQVPLVIKGNWNGDNIEYFYLPEFSFKRDHWGTILTKEPIKIDMDLWVAFLGIFLADGNLGQKERNKIQIAQSKKEETKKIYDLLDKLPFNYWTYKRKQGKNNITIFNISNNQLYDYLKNTGSGSERNIPTFIKSLSKRQIQIFLDWFFLGDGHERGDENRGKEKTYYPGLSKPIADDLQEMIIKTGHASNISTRKLNKKINYEVHHRFSDISYFLNSAVEEIDYNDYSYCVSVPNKTLLTRRNGKAIFLGNTGWSSSDHLHFEIQELPIDGKWTSINPLPLMEPIFAKDILKIKNTLKYIKEQIALLSDRLADYLRR